MTLSARVATAATTALSGAMAFLGGPVGVVIIAAAALVYFSTRASDAEKQADRLGDTVEGTTEKFKEMGAAQRALAEQGLVEKLREQELAIWRIKNSASELSKFTGFEFSLDVSDFAKIEEAEKESKKLKDQLVLVRAASADFGKVASENMEKVSKSISETLVPMLKVLPANFGVLKQQTAEVFSLIVNSVAKSAESITQIDDSTKTLIEDLKKQIALYGEESKAAEFLYDIKNGLSKVSDENAQKEILNSYRKIDALDKEKKKYEEIAEERRKAAEEIEALGKSLNESIDKQFKENIDDRFKQEEEQREALSKQNEEYKKLIESVDEFGGAWSRTGSVVAKAIGSIADSLNDYSANMEAIAKKEEELAKAKFEAYDPAKIEGLTKAEIKLSEEKTKAQIGGYGEIAGAAASMFKENSKGRKALHAVEKTLSAIELAMSIKNTVKELALSATRTTAATAEAGVNVAAGGAKMFAQSGWAGFAGVAAMIAVMASLGFSGGGGGGGGASPKDIQESQGTGSVMGDASAKSESIANALDDYKEIALDSFSELQGIRSAIVGLSSGIEKLAVSLVRGGKFSGTDISGLGTTSNFDIGGTVLEKFDFLGIAQKPLDALFGTTKKKLKDTGFNFEAQELGDILAGNIELTYYNTIETTKKKLFGLSKKVTSKDEFIGVEEDVSSQFSQIFSYLGASVNESFKLLGIETTKSINDFQLNIGKISFKDLSGEEIQKELEAIFSTQGDLIAEFMVPQISQYQKMGEGAFETLTRVSKEQTVFNDTIDKMGLSLKNVSGIMSVDVSQSIISMMGGLEEFSSKTRKYFDAFFTEEEKVKSLGDSLKEAFSSLNQDLPATRQAFRDVVEGLDLTTEADQKLFSSLMQLTPSLDEYIKATEKAAEAQVNAAEKALAAEAAQINAYEAAQERINNQRQSMELALLDELGKSEEALAIRRTLELEAMDESLRPLQNQIYAQQDLKKALEEAAKAAEEEAAISFAIGEDRNKYYENLARENEIILALAEKKQQLELALMDELGLASEALAIRRQIELDSMESSLHPIQEQIYAQQDLKKALEEATEAEAERVEKLKAIQDEILGLDKSFFDLTASESEKRVAVLKSLLSDEARSIQEKINSYNDAISKTEEFSNVFGSAINKVTETAKESASVIKNIYDSLISSISSTRANVKTSIEKFEKPKTAQELLGSLTGKSSKEQIEIIDKVNNALNNQYASQIEAIQKEKEDAQKAFQEKIDFEQKVFDVEKSNAQKLADANLAYQKQMLDYTNKMLEAADSLLLSDLSPLLAVEKLNISKKAFEDAKGEDAIKAANDYLQKARDFYASSEEYTSIFDTVQASLRNSAANPQNFVQAASVELDKMPVQTVAEKVSEFDSSAFDEKILKAQEDYKNSFMELLPKLDEIQNKASDDFENSMIELSKKTQEENEKLLAELKLQTESLGLIPEKLTETNAALTEQLSAAIAMIEEARKQTEQSRIQNLESANKSDALNRRILELTEVIERRGSV